LQLTYEVVPYVWWAFSAPGNISTFSRQMLLEPCSSTPSKFFQTIPALEPGKYILPMLPHFIPLPHRFLQPWIKLSKYTIKITTYK
jgi:hypothetical protein